MLSWRSGPLMCSSQEILSMLNTTRVPGREKCNPQTQTSRCLWAVWEAAALPHHLKMKNESSLFPPQELTHFEFCDHCGAQDYSFCMCSRTGVGMSYLRSLRDWQATIVNPCLGQVFSGIILWICGFEIIIYMTYTYKSKCYTSHHQMFNYLFSAILVLIEAWSSSFFLV